MTLTPTLAFLHAKVVIPTLEGDVSLNVPPGTQSGDRRVMTGRGMPGQRGKGHQYVHFDILMPRKLSEKQRELIEAFDEEEAPLSDDDRTRREMK